MGSQTYTTGSGNFTVPAGVAQLIVTMYGGGGIGSTGDSGGGGGGGAGCIYQYPLTVTPAQVIAYAFTTVASRGKRATFGSLICHGGFDSGETGNGGAGGLATDGTNSAAGGGADSNGEVYSTILFGGGGGGGSNNPGGSGFSLGGETVYQTGGGGGGSYGVGANAVAYSDGESGTLGSGGAGGDQGMSYGLGGLPGIELTWTDGWNHKCIGITPSKVAGIAKVDIKKVSGVAV